MTEYDEIIRLFEQSRDNADELVSLFKRLKEEEKESKYESLIRWRRYPDKKPKINGYYLCAQTSSKYPLKLVDMLYYYKANDVWVEDPSLPNLTVEEVYGVAPSAWTIVDFPNLEEDNETSN